MFKIAILVISLAVAIRGIGDPPADYVFKTCRVEETTLDHGQVWTHPVYCVQIFCYDGFIIRLLGCSLDPKPGPNCRVTPIQTNYDYPYCCPKVVCN
uniref:Single domain-containing protein n=2 Tax=Lutzomyia longipalpis TaxID=7200 RepID=A0A1B0CAQ4_LUTLO